MRHLTFAIALAGLPALASADVQVQVTAGRVAVKARAPLSEILDRIARQTGMKVVYDGAPPRNVVAAEFHGVTPARAVLGLLEGQNVNYAAMMDASGRQVTTLMILGTGASSPGKVAAVPAPVMPVISTGFDDSDAELMNDDEVVEDEGEVEAEVEEAEPEPEVEPVKAERPDAPPAGVAPWPGAQPTGIPFPGGNPAVFTPFPPPAGEKKAEQPLADPEEE